MAAVLAGGDGAVLSHRSAAQLWGLQTYDSGRVEITTPRSTRSSGQIQRHRAEPRYDEVTIRRRIPVTTASRTILDLAAVVPRDALEHALQEAEVRRLPLVPSVDELLERHAGRRGVASLRLCWERVGRGPAERTRSELERRFLAFIDRKGLPKPQTNSLLNLGDRVVEADCLWREQRVLAELDGHESHGTYGAFQGDRGRDRRLQALGWRTVRITWHQLHHEAEAVEWDLRRLLHPNTNVRDNVRSQ
jgi:very-short-patch-repair endonuclease